MKCNWIGQTYTVHRTYFLLQIFFSELKYTRIEAEVGYTLLDLTCDIGGALGLILGCTVITVCEFADYLVLVAAAWYKARPSAGVI